MISPKEALTRARETLQMNAETPGQAWRVERLDRPDDDYFLIVLGAENAAVGVATVAARTGAALSWARLAGNNPHGILGSREALALAASNRGLRADAEATLVWRACSASRSAFYPLWRIRDDAQTIYIDQQGEIRDALDWGDPGG